MSFKKNIFGICLFLFSNTYAFSENRILEWAGIDNMFRCNRDGIAPARCAKIQQFALASGCINEVEYKTLLELNKAPHCSEDELVSWCPCK